MTGSGPVFTRRAALAGAGLIAAAALTGCNTRVRPANGAISGRLPETRIGGMPIALSAEEHAITLGANTATTPAWLYGETPFPVFRMGLGENLDVTLANGLKEHTSIHWHGVRVPNAMDGVPYVTQAPVQPGERFSYRFAPPDPGTYFFHPHCDTAVQFGRGLSGVLIVEDEAESFDDDVVCVLKDWRVAGDGRFLPFVTDEGAGRSGTFGTLRTLNGQIAPVIQVPAKAMVRLRLLNLDATRVCEIGVPDSDARIVAIDGNALPPIALDTWRLGPAMRIDLALHTPEAGGSITLIDYFAPEPVTLATLVAQGENKRSGEPASGSIRLPKFAEPDLANAERHELRLSASATATDYSQVPSPIILPDGRRIDLMDSLCTTVRNFWAIDGKTWPQNGHEQMPPPLMNFAPGTSVRLQLTNTTPHVHPMHVHGHSFKVLSSSKLKRPPHWADTVLVLPEERVEIAFVADNPGNWMIHCHIIEHQDTGMMGWFRVG